MADIEAEAQRILEVLIFTPFEDCYILSRNLSLSLTRRPSIYAVRHRTQGILYIGKAKYPRERFKDGHKAFFWAWLERYDHEDIRLAIVAVSYPQWTQVLLDLEALILRASRPPYNVQIPIRD